MILTHALRAITSRYPLNTPRASILNRLPAVPADYGEFCGKNGVRYRGYWPGNDDVCRSLFWLGDFDPWVEITLSRLARPGSVAIDIGANIGATAIAMARAVGPEGRVVCFEPVPPNINYLRQNIAANRLSWVEVEPVALSDHEGELRMSLPHGHAAMARMALDGSPADFVVKSRTFDRWLEAQQQLDISVCKIDVEGHEPSVFAGMKLALANRTIPAFVFERHDVNSSLADPVLDLLVGQGYRLLRIEKGLTGVFYADISAPPKARPTTDFVAMLASKSAAMAPHLA